MTGDFETTYRQAVRLIDKMKFREAAEILEPLAKSDYQYSQIYLAYAKISSEGVQADLEPLISLLERKRSPNAAFYLALEYGRRKEFEKVADCLKLAIEFGYWAANYRMGVLVGSGLVSKDYLIAHNDEPDMKWYEQGARHGHLYCQKRIIDAKYKAGEMSLPSFVGGSILIAGKILAVLAFAPKPDMRITI